MRRKAISVNNLKVTLDSKNRKVQILLLNVEVTEIYTTALTGRKPLAIKNRIRYSKLLIKINNL